MSLITTKGTLWDLNSPFILIIFVFFFYNNPHDAYFLSMILVIQKVSERKKYI